MALKINFQPFTVVWIHTIWHTHSDTHTHLHARTNTHAQTERVSGDEILIGWNNYVTKSMTESECANSTWLQK